MRENSVEDIARRLITVAGCKGGVGKSVIAAAIALELGRLGRDVVLVDADLGAANLHTYLGIQTPERVMSDFLSHQVKTMDGITLETRYPGVRFISGAGNVPSQANPKFAQKAKIIRGLRSLKADFIIIDIGAGCSHDVMDFFSMTNDGMLVTTPEPTSVVNSYGFVKNVVYRKLGMAFRQYPIVVDLLRRGMTPDGGKGITTIRELMEDLGNLSPQCWLSAKEILSTFTPNIIVNMLASDSDAQLGEKLRSIIEKYLSVEAKCIGEVAEDSVLRVAAKRMSPFMVFAPECKAASCIRGIVQQFLLSPVSVAPAGAEAPDDRLMEG
jgi:flagellar biosynthesis protein FlhG